MLYTRPARRVISAAQQEHAVVKSGQTQQRLHLPALRVTAHDEANTMRRERVQVVEDSVSQWHAVRRGLGPITLRAHRHDIVRGEIVAKALVVQRGNLVDSDHQTLVERPPGQQRQQQ